MDLKGATLNLSDIIGRIAGPEGRDVRGSALSGCICTLFGYSNIPLAFMRVLHESVEIIEAVFPRSKERIVYHGRLQVLDSGSAPVRLELIFVPPHPFCCNMPENHSIRGKSVTEVYVKLTRFLQTSGFEFGH